MKKIYITPDMKVVEVQQRQMLCGSFDGSVKCFRGQSVSNEDNDYSDYDGYDKAW